MNQSKFKIVLHNFSNVMSDDLFVKQLAKALDKLEHIKNEGQYDTLCATHNIKGINVHMEFTTYPGEYRAEAWDDGETWKNYDWGTIDE